MKNPRANQQLEAEFIKDTQTSVPDIIKNLNPVTEHFDSVPGQASQRRASQITQEDPGYLHQLLTKAEQAICDLATD